MQRSQEKLWQTSLLLVLTSLWVNFSTSGLSPHLSRAEAPHSGARIQGPVAGAVSGQPTHNKSPVAPPARLGPAADADASKQMAGGGCAGDLPSQPARTGPGANCHGEPVKRWILGAQGCNWLCEAPCIVLGVFHVRLHRINFIASGMC